MHVANYLDLVHRSEDDFARALETIAKHHGDEPDVQQDCRLLAAWPRDHVERLAPILTRYGTQRSPEPDKLKSVLFHGPRSGGLGLVRDLHDLWLLASQASLSWIVLGQAGKALQDGELDTLCQQATATTKRQQNWLLNRVKQAAPQALVVAE